MKRYITTFQTNAEYSAATLDTPNVSLVEEDMSVHYSPYVPTPPSFDGKFKLTYSDESVYSAACDSTSAITKSDVYAGSSSYEDIKEVIIGDCVTSIGDEAFEECYKITAVTIPNSVTSIGDATFSKCSALSSITIPSGVTLIDNYAFENCPRLTSVTIPNTVTSIGYSVFEGCEGLESVTIEATTPPTLGNNAFNYTNDCPIYVPSASVNAYKAASGWSTYASRIQAIS